MKARNEAPAKVRANWVAKWMERIEPQLDRANPLEIPIGESISRDQAQDLAEELRARGLTAIATTERLCVLPPGADYLTLIPNRATLTLQKTGPNPLSLSGPLGDCVARFLESRSGFLVRGAERLSIQKELSKLDRAQLRQVARVITHGHPRYQNMAEHGALSEARTDRQTMDQILCVLEGNAFGQVLEEGPLEGVWCSNTVADRIDRLEQALGQDQDWADTFKPVYFHQYEYTPGYRIKQSIKRIERFVVEEIRFEPKKARAAIKAWANESLERCRKHHEVIQAAYERSDRETFEPIRSALRAGNYTKEDFLKDVEKRASPDPYRVEQEFFVESLLGIEQHPTHTLSRDRTTSLYQSTMTETILSMLKALDPSADDVIVDLGSGLGKVVMLAHWLTGARGIGVEYEEAHTESARRAVKGMGLEKGVDLVCADARDADYSKGTIFYLFNPFNGEIMDAVADRIREEAAKRQIKICGVTAAPAICDAGWLVKDEEASTPGATVWVSKPPGDPAYASQQD